MRKAFTVLIVLPLALILIVFAVANRHFVMVSFDPFNSTDPALALSLPLFVLIIAVAILGVVAGGLATWFGQHHWRRAARRHGLTRGTPGRNWLTFGPPPWPRAASRHGLPGRPRSDFTVLGETSRAQHCKNRRALKLV